MKSIIVGPDQGRVVPKDKDLLIVVQEEEIENFKTALSRAVSTWQDPPPEILLLKQKLCGDPMLRVPKWPNPADHNFLATPERKTPTPETSDS